MCVCVAVNQHINLFIGEKHIKRKKQMKKAALISTSSSAAFYAMLSMGLYLILSEISILFLEILQPLNGMVCIHMINKSYWNIIRYFFDC